MPAQPLRIGIWAAVSSERQAADDKFSLDDQIAAGERFAAAVGGQIVSRYIVPGHTRDLVLWSDAESAMPAYRQFREDVQAGRIDVLHVLDEDRLGRDPALSAQVISLLEKRGGEVYAADTPHTIGSKTVAHRYISAIKGVRAAEDQSLRRYRFAAGMKSRILKRNLHAGHWPMGYQPVRDESGKVIGAEPDGYAAAVLEITRLFLAGLSVPEIGRRMTAGPYQPVRSDRWRISTISRVVGNDTYAGLVRWSDHKSTEPSPRFMPLWDGPTFAAMVRERQRRSKGPYSRTGGGPFTGVAFCAECGTAMYRAKHPRSAGIFSLYCGRHRQYRDECHSNHISEHKVTAALSAVLAMLCNTAVLDAALERLGAGNAERSICDDRDRAAAHAAELAEQRLRLAHALAAGKMAADVYYQVDSDLAARLAVEQGRAADLARAIDALPDIDNRREALAALARDFGVAVKVLEPPVVAAMLQRAGIRVYTSNHQVVRIEIGG